MHRLNLFQCAPTPLAHRFRYAHEMMTSAVILRPEGLYCPAGDFYIDPWRPVEHAVLTHGHSDHARPGSAQYQAVDIGAGILRQRLGADMPLRTRAYGERWQMQAATVSLHPAGHILGSAQVRIEVAGKVTVVTGDYKRDVDPTCAPFEVVPCDTLITEATFALPIYRWQPTEVTAAEIFAWWQAQAARGYTCVLCCYALGKAQRVLAALRAHTQQTVLLHGAMVPLVQVYRDAGVQMLDTQALSEHARSRDLSGALILAPPSAARSPWMRHFGNVSVGFASGWMAVRGARRRAGYDRGFVLSDHADWNGLVRTARETGAKHVWATHGNTDSLVRFLTESGIQAGALNAIAHETGLIDAMPIAFGEVGDHG
jgi:putative mRNA 3-end processing factor